MPEEVLVNPGHRPTSYGLYRGNSGEEFAQILQEYRRANPNNSNLKRITNLHGKGTDILLLAQNIKLKYPEKSVNLLNASDPDVTLGNHVCEYVNNCPHTGTTEENYGALGTTAFGFEGITGLQEKGPTPLHLKPIVS